MKYLVIKFRGIYANGSKGLEFSDYNDTRSGNVFGLGIKAVWRGGTAVVSEIENDIGSVENLTVPQSHLIAVYLI